MPSATSGVSVPLLGGFRRLFTGHPAGFHLREPSTRGLSRYEAALVRGWSPNTYEDRSQETLRALRHDRVAFLNGMTSCGNLFGMPPGEAVPLDTRIFWMWDGDFAGRIVLRTVPRTHAVHPCFAGHVGYSVVPWARRKGHATAALSLLLDVARGMGMDEVAVGCGEANPASRRVAEANGGKFQHGIPDPACPAAMAAVYLVPTSVRSVHGGS